MVPIFGEFRRLRTATNTTGAISSQLLRCCIDMTWPTRSIAVMGVDERLCAL